MNTHIRLWAAQRILRYLASANRGQADEAPALAELLAFQGRMQQIHGRMVLARSRGLALAAARLDGELKRAVQVLPVKVQAVIDHPNRQPVPPPDLRLILEELEQLEREFEQVELDPKRRVLLVHTPPITLEDVELGPFAIELHLSRLSGRPGSGAFDCLALEPNPAASDDRVTHPHVRDNQLCAGEASVPIAQALKQGRINDAFGLISAVLHTYNGGSPYVALDVWTGESCHDCGRTVSIEDLYRCEGCEDDYCGHCIGNCDLCDGSYCPDCLESDPVSGKSCCSGCCHTCGDCGRTVDAGSFDEDRGLCPECLEAQAESDQEDEHHDHESGQPIPASV